MNFGKAKPPNTFYWVLFAYLFYSFLFTPNFGLTLPIAIFPLFIYRLFWLPKQLNVLFWGMLLQWTLPAAQVLYCNLLGITLAEKMEDVPLYSRTVEMATLLNIVGLYAFSLGMYLVTISLRNYKIKTAIFTYPPKKVVIGYIAFGFLTFITGNIIWAFPGLVQFFFVFFYIKWGFFLVTFYVVHKYASNYRWYFYGFVAFELILGLSSFFAGQIIFVVIFTGVAIFHIQPRINFRTGVLALVSFLLLFNYLILWSAVKREYREYVSKGLVTQSVHVSSEDARNKLFDLISNVDADQYQLGLEQFVDRVGYIHFFAAALNHVPKKVPHQNGDVYWAAVQHYLIPRFLNPNKEILDDSKHTTRYTGIGLSSRKEGTSFSLGYITDAYVDYGPIGMHILLFFVGILFGLCYRFLVTSSPNDFWLWVLTGPFIIILNINGADTKKALGSLIIYFVMILVSRKPLIRFVESYLKPELR